MGTSLFAPSTWQGHLDPVDGISGPKPAPAAPAAPAAAATNAYATPSGQTLTQQVFPQGGFSGPQSFQYLMQVLGMGNGQGAPGTNAAWNQQAQQQQPQQASPQGSPLGNFGQMDFGSMFQQLLGQIGQGQAPGGTKPQIPGYPSNLGGFNPGGFTGGSSYPQMGPPPNPLSALNQYAGPFGNGGGYFGGVKSIQPVQIKAPPQTYY